MSLQERKIYSWIAETCAKSEDFEEWYYKYKTLIDDSVSLLIKHLELPESKLALYVFESSIRTSYYAPPKNNNVLIEWALEDTCYIGWQAGLTRKESIGQLTFRGKSTFGVELADDMQYIFLGDKNSNMMYGEFHCETGVHHTINGVDKYYLWGSEYTKDEFDEITASQLSIEHYKLIHLLSR
jgi:hypothetical protein